MVTNLKQGSINCLNHQGFLGKYVVHVGKYSLPDRMIRDWKYFAWKNTTLPKNIKSLTDRLDRSDK